MSDWSAPVESMEPLEWYWYRGPEVAGGIAAVQIHVDECSWMYFELPGISRDEQLYFLDEVAGDFQGPISPTTQGVETGR